MKKITTTLTILLAAVIAMPVTAVAQDPFDDLYYSPSKAEKQKKENEKKQRELQAQLQDYTTMPASYPSADSYTGGSDKPLNIDVDAYNRRGVSPTHAASDTSGYSDFAYTKRIERFYNPEVVAESGDSTVMQYYYSTEPATTQNIDVYVINSIDPWDSFYSPWYNPYRYSYWGPSWSFGWGNPWYGPSFSWGWTDPWYYPSYGWGWGWTPGWGPSWGPGWGPGWMPGWTPGPLPPTTGGWASNSPGASRPHRPSTGVANGSNRRPGTGNSNMRPGNYGRPSSGWGQETRPGNLGNNSSVRPGNNGSSIGGPSNNSRRGQGSRYGTNRSTQSPSNNNRTYNPNRNNNSNNNSFFNQGGGSYRNSGGSYHGGGGGGRSTGGGGGFGGGGGRGRR